MLIELYIEELRALLSRMPAPLPYEVPEDDSDPLLAKYRREENHYRNAVAKIKTSMQIQGATV